ncbi:hypothetical protein SDC9_92794 [bioreactor metagenome]|uniref:DUF4003 domain-containing protein n=1 Tax=bioreactor metagenome TaxID=1076179 RepID=A0A645A060_9ZZZZ
MSNTKNLFVDNTQAIKNEFVWSSMAQAKKLAALFYALEGKKIDVAAMKETKAYIKQNTGVFSSFRGNMGLSVATLLSLMPNKEEIFADTLTVYDKLKSARFSNSDYLIMAAFQIAANTAQKDHDAVVARTRAFYDGMKSHHWFCTSQDDYIFCAVLAMSNVDVASGVEKIESYIEKLSGKLGTLLGKNSIQGLAEVLTLGGTADKSDRVFELNETLKTNKLKLNRDLILPVLGILTLLPVSNDTIVRELSETRDYLRLQKGFGKFSVPDYEVLLYAAALFINSHIDELKSDALSATLSTSVAGIIIAAQTAMICAACVASSAAAASSAST